MITELFDILALFRDEYKATFDERWGGLAIIGTYNNEDKSPFGRLNVFFLTHDISASLSYFIGKNICSFDEFLADIQEQDVWRININKEVLIREKREEFHQNFFFIKPAFFEWSSGINPLEESNPFNRYSPIKIIVNNIDCRFGGPRILVCSQHSANSTFEESNPMSPSREDILDVVHVADDKPFCINAENHLITFGAPHGLIPNDYLKNSAKVLLCCLVNEIHKDDKVVLRGVRRLEMNLCGNEEVSVSFKFNKQLLDAVRWVYGENEKRDLRLKLLLERVTLDIDLSTPLIVGLPQVLENSLQQAKERYSFIVYERKDAYQKELKELLKDLKNLSELYSSKVRLLLNNLLRDVLAAFLLVGITLFSKAEEISKLLDNTLIWYVFVAFGCYFITSAIFQMITDIFDMRRSRREFDYWKNVSREYMSRNDFENHKKETLNKRRCGTITIYVIIVLGYIAISFVCFRFPDIWDKIINQV